MRTWMLGLLLLPCLAWGVSSNQGGDHQLIFANDTQKTRYTSLIEVLRCPKCQNQSIADSDAPISQDLRMIVYDMIRQGESDQDILNYLKARYGDFVHYEPPMDGRTLPLWLGPLLIFLLGIGVWFRSWRSQQHQSSKPIEEEEQST